MALAGYMLMYFPTALWPLEQVAADQPLSG